jgi:hypothetical protein
MRYYTQLNPAGFFVILFFLLTLRLPCCCCCTFSSSTLLLFALSLSLVYENVVVFFFHRDFLLLFFISFLLRKHVGQMTHTPENFFFPFFSDFFIGEKYVREKSFYSDQKNKNQKFFIVIPLTTYR